jgi:hypothetical protein
MMATQKAKRTPISLDGLEAFERWHEQQTHDKGPRITPDKAIVRADVQNWVLRKLGFKIDEERIDEHCLYKAGQSGTATKRFPQPKKNPDLRIVKDGVYTVARGKSFYTYETRSHSNK